MDADIRPGQGFVATVPFLDRNGSPVTGATTGTKVGTVKGPSGTTLTTGTVTDQGGGRWGFYVAPSFHTALGTYTFTVDQIISGSDSLTNAVATYDVGYDNTWTLRELYTTLRVVGLEDGWQGTTSGNGSAATLVCAAFKYGGTNDWMSSELFLFEPGAATDTNPVRVIGFDPATGTFTFVPNITSTVTGQDFILGNRDGQGWAHERIMLAIRRAVRKAGGGAALTDETSLTYSTTTAEYAVPATFAEVTDLAYQPTGAQTGEWLPIAPRYWSWQPDRRRVVFTRQVGGVYTAAGYGTYGAGWRAGNGFAIPQGALLRLTGRATLQLPALMGQGLDADGSRVYDLALLELLLTGTPEDRQQAVMRAGAMGRPPVRLPR